MKPKRKLNVLVACESSGTVRDAFRKLGHNAWSCDLLPCDTDPRFHIQDDIFKVLQEPWRIAKFPTRICWDGMWDLMIAHPPCTYLCNSGVRWLYRKKAGLIQVDPVRWTEMQAGAKFFNLLWNAYPNLGVEHLAIENPIMHGHGRRLIGAGKPDQLIQPYMFGHLETKATCLWLKNLPKLTPTVDVVESKRQMLMRPKSERNRIHMMPPGTNRWKERSKTYQFIADAMSAQWSEYILNENSKTGSGRS